MSSKKQVKKAVKPEAKKTVKSEAPKLTFRVIPNTRVQGRAPSDDRFTLSKGNALLFNVQTRRKLNIPIPAYVEFHAANEEGQERNVFLRFRKTRRTTNCMKVGKLGDKYYKVSVPTAAAKMVGMVFKSAGTKGKRKRSIIQYKGEAYQQGSKKRMIMLTPVEVNN